jgi:hypothetical protein
MAAGCSPGAPAIRYYRLSPVDLRLLLRPRILFKCHLQLSYTADIISSQMPV